MLRELNVKKCRSVKKLRTRLTKQRNFDIADERGNLRTDVHNKHACAQPYAATQSHLCVCRLIVCEWRICERACEIVYAYVSASMLLLHACMCM